MTAPPATLGMALAWGSAALAPQSASARLDAAVLLRHAADLSAAALIATASKPIATNHWSAFETLIRRRAAGEPVAYLTGRREFWSLTLRVTPAVLIPRPDTETLVETALARIPRDAAWRIADLGTGSGAVALALGDERPHCRIVATDVSTTALAVARANAQAREFTHITFRRGSWCVPLAGERFEMLVANPPYVATGDPHLDQGDLRFEPRAALVSGADGLDAIRCIAAQAIDHLRPGGWLLLEHGFDQAVRVAQCLQAAGLVMIATHTDAAGRQRVTGGQQP